MTIEQPNTSREAFDEWRELQDNSRLRSETAWQTVERSFRGGQQAAQADILARLDSPELVLPCPDCNGAGWFGSGEGSGPCDGACGGSLNVTLKKIVGSALVDFMAMEREGKMEPKLFVHFEERIIKAALAAVRTFIEQGGK